MDVHSRPLRLTNETAVSVIAPKTSVWEKKRTMSPDVKTLGNAGTSQVDVAAVGAVAVQIGVLWHSRGAPNLPLRPQALSTQVSRVLPPSPPLPSPPSPRSPHHAPTHPSHHSTHVGRATRAWEAGSWHSPHRYVDVGVGRR